MDKINFLSIFFLASTLISCSNHIKSGDDISEENLNYIRGLGILDEDERIIFFDTQGGFNGIKMAGNFFTDKRIASYWIDKGLKDKTSINYAYYYEIDSIKVKDLTKALTYSSYLEIYKNNGDKFKVYVDEDSSGTWRFFNLATNEWNAKRKIKTSANIVL